MFTSTKNIKLYYWNHIGHDLCGLHVATCIIELCGLIIYSLRCRLDVSFNLITHSVINSDVHVASKLNSIWIATLYNLTAL